MSDFTDCMEAKAVLIAETMAESSADDSRVPNWSDKAVGVGGEVFSNIKPWYSPYANFEPEMCDVVVIGVNPGGNPKRPDNTTGPMYGMNLNKPRGKYNAYLDETWEGETAAGKGKLQRGVVSLFQALYGADEWERQLRNAASFNVCPLRTRKARHIPWDAWNESLGWCRNILSYLEPERVICLANVGPRTPWAAVKGPRDNAGFYRDFGKPGDDYPTVVQAGVAGFAGLNRCEVIGVPHLSYHYDNDAVFEALGAYANTR